MRKKLLVSLVTGMVILGNAFIANAIPTEIVPVSYTFDKTTDVGTYNYSDWTGSQLTDGHYGITPWSADLGNGYAYEWVGWVRDTPVNIDFDLGAILEINQINIGTVQDWPNDVVLPSVNLYSSNDGTNWSLFEHYFVPESNSNNNIYRTYEFTGLSVTAQYFRVSLYHSYDGPWTFTDEIDFYQDSAAPVPEPTTMLLFGTGLAGLVGTKLRKKKK